MRTTVAAAVAALAVGLAGCSDSGQPSPPPTPDQPTTTSSPADTSPTTEAAPTTEAPSESASTELPPEATEDSEAGAEAFVQHYLDLLNELSQEPRAGALEKLAAAECQTCRAFEASLVQLEADGQRTAGAVVENVRATAVDAGAETVVTTDFDQLGPATLDRDGRVVREGSTPKSVTLVFSLIWEDGAWLVNEIQVAD